MRKFASLTSELRAIILSCRLIIIKFVKNWANVGFGYSFTLFCIPFHYYSIILYEVSYNVTSQLVIEINCVVQSLFLNQAEKSDSQSVNHALFNEEVYHLKIQRHRLEFSKLTWDTENDRCSPGGNPPLIQGNA